MEFGRWLQSATSPMLQNFTRWTFNSIMNVFKHTSENVKAGTLFHLYRQPSWKSSFLNRLSFANSADAHIMMSFIRLTICSRACVQSNRALCHQVSGKSCRVSHQRPIKPGCQPRQRLNLRKGPLGSAISSSRCPKLGTTDWSVRRKCRQ